MWGSEFRLMFQLMRSFSERKFGKIRVEQFPFYPLLYEGERSKVE